MIKPKSGIKSSNLILSVVFAAVIIGFALTSELKREAQIFIIFFCVLTMATLYMKGRYNYLLFYILSGVTCFTNVFQLIGLFANLINPGDGWITIDGEKHRVMGTNWIWAAFSGFTFTVLLLFWYHRVWRNKVLEILFVAGVLLISTTRLLAG